MRKILAAITLLIMAVLAACGGGSAEEEAVNGVGEYYPAESPAPSPNPTPPPAEEARPIVVRHIFVTTANLNLRDRPTTDSRVLGVVADGTWVEVLEFYSDEWYRVSALGAPSIHNPDAELWEGYMAVEFLRIVERTTRILPDAVISDYGRQAALDFLAQRNAANFLLFDLDNSGVPDILLISAESEGSRLYRYVDARYMQVMFNPDLPIFDEAEILRFFLDEYNVLWVAAVDRHGNLSDYHSVMLSADVINMHSTLNVDMRFGPEFHGLTEILPFGLGSDW